MKGVEDNIRGVRGEANGVHGGENGQKGVKDRKGRKGCSEVMAEGGEKKKEEGNRENKPEEREKGAKVLAHGREGEGKRLKEGFEKSRSKGRAEGRREKRERDKKTGRETGGLNRRAKRDEFEGRAGSASRTEGVTTVYSAGDTREGRKEAGMGSKRQGRRRRMRREVAG
eukprot:4005023-Pleurochrysis_carterae.AAC.1